MEPRFGRDFGRVRVHTDAKAAESARAMEALAYTVGNDIVFAQGYYEPSTDSGRRLIAHELTHTVQQMSNYLPPRAVSFWIDSSGEADAERAAADVMAGRRLGSVRSVSAAAVQRQELLPIEEPIPFEGGFDIPEIGEPEINIEELPQIEEPPELQEAPEIGAPEPTPEPIIESVPEPTPEPVPEPVPPVVPVPGEEEPDDKERDPCGSQGSL